MYDSPAIQLSGEAKTVFDENFDRITGGCYRPIAYFGKRLNNGYTEYAYMVITNAVVPDPDYYMTVLTLRRDSEGNMAGLVSHEILGKRTEVPDDGKLQYEFTGNETRKPGYAQGTITLNADAAGTYKLYWADNRKALDGYYPIGTLELRAGKSGSVTFGYHTAIPAGATKIIATTDSLYTSDAYSVYTIPQYKLLSSVSGTQLYTFSVYSDIHLDKRDGELYWKRAESNLRDAFALSTEKNADYVVISGDCVTCSKIDEEWKTYQKILSQSDYVNPVWECIGNHELKASSDVSVGLNKFIKGTGTDGSTNSKPYFSMVEEKSGDLFVFMALELSKDPNKDAVFSQTQLDWARSVIGANYNSRNIFLVEHAPVKGYCAGDRLVNPYYGGLMDSTIGSNSQFKQLLKDYPKVTFLSGHTHEDFSMGYNYFDDNGNAANMIHTPALAGSTLPDPDDDSKLTYSNGNCENCQGYLVQVFENEIVFNGLNVTDEGLIFPQYCYIMEGARTSASATGTTPQEITLTGTEVSAADTLGKVSNILSKYYTYSSYDAYQSLKKLYYQYRNSPTFDKAVEDEFKNRVNSLSVHTGTINFNSVGDTYYFTNNKKWSSVYAYAWTGSTKNGDWPGVQLSKVGTNSSNEDIYQVKFSSAGEFQNLIFNNGSNSAQTVDIVLSDYAENAFYIDGTSSGKFTVRNYTYNGSGTDPEQPEQPENPTLTDKVYLNHYISGEHDWSNYDTPFTADNDGKYRYTFTSRGSNNLSFSIYNQTTGKYICVPESIKPTYEEGVSATYALTTSSSRGSSVTVYGLSEGKKVGIEYDPVALTVKVTFGETAPEPPVVEDPVNDTTVSKTSFTVGEAVTITGRASGGTEPYSYEFYYKRSTASSWTRFGSGSSARFAPSSAGSFVIRSVVSDSAGKTDTKEIALTAAAALQNKTTASKTSFTVGEISIITGAASGGSGAYTYEFYYQRTGASSWTRFGSGSTARFAPSSAGSFTIRTYVKDGTGKAARKDISLTAGAALQNKTTVSKTSFTVGETIKITGAASGGSSPYTYEFYYQRRGASTWTRFGGSNAASFKPGAAGSFTIRTYVKDSTGKAVRKDFSLTATN